jgi:hypothetical protein
MDAGRFQIGLHVKRKVVQDCRDGGRKSHFVIPHLKKLLPECRDTHDGGMSPPVDVTASTVPQK